ncbi:unnamed protein product [Urochloa decumbens]|uniref:DUF1618 domain-containing protein n=1 Tax=Urochloa decumbens TaxID=240449 RepID=A0ABC9E8D1_9POAL
MRWVILNRIIRMDTGPGDAAAGAPAQEQEQRAAAAGAPPVQGQHAAAAADFILRPILPPSQSPLLAHFSVHPFHGTQFTDNGIHESNLIVVHDFHDAGGGTGTAVAERVQRQSGRIPILSSIWNVSFATDDRGGYQIVELQTDRGRDLATVIYFCTTRLDGWYEKRMACPSEVSRTAAASPRETRRRRASTRSAASRVAGGKLRYVEIIDGGGGGGAPMVAMWTWSRLPDGNGWQWEAEYAVNVEEIWDDDSYKTTGLTRSVPLLVVVSLADPHLVYFALEERIFGVNVPQHRVVHGTAYEPLDLPWDE